jgi:hypothetical protein
MIDALIVGALAQSSPPVVVPSLVGFGLTLAAV